MINKNMTYKLQQISSAVILSIALSTTVQAAPPQAQDFESKPYDVYEFGLPSQEVTNTLILWDNWMMRSLGVPKRQYFFDLWGEFASATAYQTHPDSSIEIFKEGFRQVLPTFQNRIRLGVMTPSIGSDAEWRAKYMSDTWDTVSAGTNSYTGVTYSPPSVVSGETAYSNGGGWYNIQQYAGMYYNGGTRFSETFLNQEIKPLNSSHLSAVLGLFAPTPFVEPLAEDPASPCTGNPYGCHKTTNLCLSAMPPGVTCTAGVYSPTSVALNSFYDPKTDPIFAVDEFPLSGAAFKRYLDMSPTGPVTAEVLNYFSSGVADAAAGGPAAAPASSSGCFNDENRIVYISSPDVGDGGVYRPDWRHPTNNISWTNACLPLSYTSPLVDASNTFPHYLRYGYWEKCLSPAPSTASPNIGHDFVQTLKDDGQYDISEVFYIEGLAETAKTYFDNDILFYVIARTDDIHTDVLNLVAEQGGTEKYYEIGSIPDIVDALDEVLTPREEGEDFSSLSDLNLHIPDSRGFGMSVSARYSGRFRNNRSPMVSWVGDVNALWVDRRGNLREDGGVKGKLEDCTTDPVVQFTSNQSHPDPRFDRKGLVIRYGPGAGSTPEACVPGSIIGLSYISNTNGIWSAQREMAKLTEAQILAQRAYGATADTGRHILTSFDGVTMSEFSVSGFSSANKAYLAADPAPGDGDDSPSDNVINFVRGQEVSGLRSRQTDIDGDGVLDILRLGDFVHSSPLSVGMPTAQYDTQYGDPTYGDFVAANANRRTVVYAGGNDGMIHAFNGGFWDGSSLSFKTSDAGKTAHPLGAELWAYVPKNLLPHLQWLTDPEYGIEASTTAAEHVFLMDGPGQVFDVKLGGQWRSLLVMGMRLGGGDFPVGAETLRSAYVILDVTDPESPPTLFAEITDPNLGFTTSQPALYKSYDATADSYEWKLVFGSGPTELTGGTSNSFARIYEYDLKSKILSSRTIPGYNKGFVGDVMCEDWDKDYVDDFCYFGVNRGNSTADISGGIKRYDPADNSVTTLLNLTGSDNRPIVHKPVTARSPDGGSWVFTGTGRFLTPNDEVNNDQQVLIGVFEPTDADGVFTKTQVPSSQLLNTSNIRSYVDGSVSGAPGGADTIEALREEIRENHKGWLYVPPGLTDIRSLAPPTRLGSEIYFTLSHPNTTVFTPENACGIRVAQDRSHLVALDYSSGVPGIYAILGTGGNGGPNGEPEINATYNLGNGISSKVQVISNPIAGDGNITRLLSQGQRGNIQEITKIIIPKRLNLQSWRDIEQ